MGEEGMLGRWFELFVKVGHTCELIIKTYGVNALPSYSQLLNGINCDEFVFNERLDLSDEVVSAHIWVDVYHNEVLKGRCLFSGAVIAEKGNYTGVPHFILKRQPKHTCEFVDVGFMQPKWVCKHCNAERKD